SRCVQSLFFAKQNAADEVGQGLEFSRVLFRSVALGLSPAFAAHARVCGERSAQSECHGDESETLTNMTTMHRLSLHVIDSSPYVDRKSVVKGKMVDCGGTRGDTKKRQR